MAIASLPPLVLLLALLALPSRAQEYPSCPGGSPLSVGNSTDPYNLHVIQLSSFLILADAELELAFEHYLSSGDASRAELIMSRSKNFYIIVTVVLSGVSLVLFVMLARMGDLKFSQRERFEQLKREGYSSPLSAFFTLLAVALLAFTAFAAYLVPAMITSLKMTECRLDSLNRAFLDGSPQYGWDGLAAFLQKLSLGTALSASLGAALSAPDFALLGELTALAAIYTGQAESLYAGVKDSYSAARIAYNASKSIALSELIPNLTTSVLAELDSLFALLAAAAEEYDQLERILNESQPVLAPTTYSLANSSLLLHSLRGDYTSRFVELRVRTAPYFRSAQFSLIVSELLVGFTMLGCVVSIVTIRLIQARFDFFSLRVYRVIWGSHIIVFCLNLASLLVASQMMLYAEGACALAEKVLNNRTKLAELLPDVDARTGLALVNSCIAGSDDFTVNTNTAEEFRQISGFLRAKESVTSEYNTDAVGNFHRVFQDLRLNLTLFKTGAAGSYSLLDQQLAAINAVLLNDPYREHCFKHHWQFRPSACNSSDSITVLPARPFRLDSSLTAASFPAYPTACYLLSTYDAFYPHVITASEFISLYGNFLSGNCSASLGALKPLIVDFFAAEESKEAVVESLTQQLLSLEDYLRNGSYYLLQYLSQRVPFLTALSARLNSSTTDAFLSGGNDCGVVGAMATGVYNEFCINYRAQGRQVYLIVLCNLAYSVLLILLSFLYALELQTLNEAPEEQDTERVIFAKTHSEIAESNGSIAQLESRSSSSKSDERK